MVEMVIVLPVLLMLLFALGEFGVMFGQWLTITNAAREGARTAVVFRTACNGGAVEAEVRQRVRDYAGSAGITLADADIVVAGVCGDNDTSSTVNVTHEYDFNVLPGFAASVGPTIDLIGRSVMRNEGSG